MLAGTAAALVVACTPVTTPTPGQSAAPAKALKKLSIGIGTLSFSTMQQALRYFDEKNKIVNQIGKDFGYDLEVRWLEFPVAPEEFAAFQSGDVVIGPMATFPMIGQLKKGEPYRILTNSLGMYPFMLMVKKGGGITNFDQLKGQTVGLALGTAHQFVFENFVLAQTGKTAKDFGITLASQPIPIPTMPRGLAAYQTFSPAILPALAKPDSEIEPLYQLSAPPQTGPAYNGPLGKGAGIAIPEAKRSPWFPEGFIALRNLFVVRDAFLKEHPDVVKAFVIAHQRVIRELAGLKPSQVTDLFPTSTWEGMPRKAYEEKAIATDLMYKHRDWVWPGEDVVKVLLGESQQMVKIGVLKEPLSIAEVKAAFEPTMPILKAAFEATGNYPDDKIFTNPQAQDLRGLPVWKLDFDKLKDFDVYK
jgi:ABC-type nitrate/sulfonate/bicarbonate transport system substrate-binding protein